MPKETILALRAISALVLDEFLRPLVFVVTIVLGALLALTLFLSLSFSAWWLLLLFILVPTMTALAIGYCAVKWALRVLLPRALTADERTKLRNFSKELLAIAERTQTPYFVLLFMMIRDVIRRQESTFLYGIIDDSKNLVREFGDIQKMFREKG